MLRMRWALLGSVLVLATTPTWGQYNERPDLVGSGSPAVDASGRSIKNPRVRAVHTDDPSLLGGTADFIARDPFLAFQLGRNLNFREFRTRDGVFSVVGNLAGPTPNGTTAKITANNQTSCLGCHNLPPGNAGGGTNFHKDSGFGRNAPHYYGAGIMEMLAIQVRSELLTQIDTNADGWVSAAEAQAAPATVFATSAPGQSPLDFGNPRLDGGATGEPSFNNIIRVWYVDANGVHVPGATGVDGVTTAGYNFNVIVWGWGQGTRRSALNPTNRVFYWDPILTHTGLDSHDPSTLNDPDGDGVSEPTLAGAVQFPATHQAPDAGVNLSPQGYSLDDPDGDGYLTEISEGDLDLAEWFMLNVPRPAFAGTPREYERGLRAMNAMGCTECHVANWEIQAQDATYAGDRRIFDFETSWDASSGKLTGRLQPLYTKNGTTHTPNRDSFMVTGLFTDFRQHFMGAEFSELDFGGVVNDIWRTAPLWGVGSSFPWGHDGRSLTLEDAILRHGGEGAASRAAYLAAPRPWRDALINMLEKMVLYDVESLPADINGDGVISPNFVVAGVDTGVERFNAEWLFETPLKIQGDVVNFEGVTIRSSAGTNIDDAYGLNLPYRIDSDLDGWPDVWDSAPNSPGFLDGTN